MLFGELLPADAAVGGQEEELAHCGVLLLRCVLVWLFSVGGLSSVVYIRRGLVLRRVLGSEVKDGA